MQSIRISCDLPFVLALADGPYADQTPSHADQSPSPLYLRELPSPSPETHIGLRVWTIFTSDGLLTPADMEGLKEREARAFLRRINRLIRWYRVVSSDRSVAELTLWKASPFRFLLEPSLQEWA